MSSQDAHQLLQGPSLLLLELILLLLDTQVSQVSSILSSILFLENLSYILCLCRNIFSTFTFHNFLSPFPYPFLYLLFGDVYLPTFYSHFYILFDDVDFPYQLILGENPTLAEQIKGILIF